MMAGAATLPRSRARGFSLPLGLLGVTVAVALTQWQQYALNDSSLAFVNAQGNLQRLELESRDVNVAMQNRGRRGRRYNLPKKNHIKWEAPKAVTDTYRLMPRFYAFSQKFDLYQHHWAQTLKISFAEGEDGPDVVTEAEVRDYFTKEGFEPDAVVVGYQREGEEKACTYVHFPTHELCKKARYIKTGPLGKAKEFKAVYTHEKQWIRVRDGVSMKGFFFARRGWHAKAYGFQVYDNIDLGQPSFTGVVSSPYYPD